MKKLVLLSTLFSLGLMNAQHYFGTEFVGESGINFLLTSSRTNNKIVMAGYVGGSLTGNFPISFKGGNADGTLTSLSTTDGTIQWIKQFASKLDDVVVDATVDASGNYYLTGYFMGAGTNAFDADPGPAVYPLSVTSSFANRDIFIIKLDSNGDFLWAKQMSSPSGAANDDVATIKLDSSGNIYLAGSYVYVDFDPGAGEQIYTATGSSDAFVVKLDNDGNFIWVKTLNGTSSKKIMDMEIDSDNNIYVTGRYQGTIDLNPDATLTDVKTRVGGFDTFVAKYTPSGDYVWGHSYGGTGADISEKILVHGNNVYVGGSFTGTVDLDPTSGTNSVTSAGGTDAYLSSFTKDGAYNSSFVIPGSTTNADNLRDFYIDDNGNFYLAGLFQNINIGGNNYTSSAANSDVYYIKLNSDMNFSNIYLVKGSQAQDNPLIIPLDSIKFLGTGASKGTTSYDYTNPSNTSNPSTASYYSYITKFDFEANPTLASNELSKKPKISIYPNPAKNDVNIKTDNRIKAVAIYNTEGRKVYTAEKLELKNINVAMLPSGMYFLQTTDEKGNINQTKLIKN